MQVCVGDVGSVSWAPISSLFISIVLLRAFPPPMQCLLTTSKFTPVCLTLRRVLCHPSWNVFNVMLTHCSLPRSPGDLAISMNRKKCAVIRFAGRNHEPNSLQYFLDRHAIPVVMGVATGGASRGRAPPFCLSGGAGPPNFLRVLTITATVRERETYALGSQRLA